MWSAGFYFPTFQQQSGFFGMLRVCGEDNKDKRGGNGMDTKENTQEMTETQPSDLPQDSFQLADHPWLAADVTVEDEIRYALDEIRL